MATGAQSETRNAGETVCSTTLEAKRFFGKHEMNTLASAYTYKTLLRRIRRLGVGDFCFAELQFCFLVSCRGRLCRNTEQLRQRQDEAKPGGEIRLSDVLWS